MPSKTKCNEIDIDSHRLMLECAFFRPHIRVTEATEFIWRIVMFLRDSTVLVSGWKKRSPHTVLKCVCKPGTARNVPAGMNVPSERLKS
jgi:hypothetical protein